MPDIMTKEAVAVSKKLAKGTKDGKLRTEESSGGKHQIVKVYYDNKRVGQFGLQRGSKQQRHNYIADQLHITRSEAYNYAICDLASEAYVDILRKKEKI